MKFRNKIGENKSTKEVLFAISINFVKFRFHGRVFGGEKQEALIVAFGPNDAGKN